VVFYNLVHVLLLYNYVIVKFLSGSFIQPPKTYRIQHIAYTYDNDKGTKFAIVILLYLTGLIIA
jgi:hypothetical protein